MKTVVKDTEKENVELHNFIESHLEEMKGDLSYTQYWDYSDEISSETMQKVISRYTENHKNDFDYTLVNALYEEFDYLFVDNYFVAVDNIVDELKLKYDFLKEYDSSDIREEIQDYINFDLNLEGLLKKSYPEDLTVYLNNPDDDYCSEDGWKDIDQENLPSDEELEEILSESALKWLLKTQGYSVRDMYEKHSENAFLKGVYEEIYSYINVDYLEGNVLIAIPNGNNWGAIARLAAKEPVTIKAGTKFGLFNTFSGGGSGLGIELEKDIVVSNEVDGITIACSRERFNYSPKAVYDYIRGSENQLEVVEDK